MLLILLMRSGKLKKSKKTFPLEIEDALHKALKVKAIEEDKTLHSLIIDTLATCVQEGSVTYRIKTQKVGEK